MKARKAERLTGKDMLAEFIFAGLVVSGLGVAYVANDTEKTCKDESSKLPPTVPASLLFACLSHCF